MDMRLVLYEKFVHIAQVSWWWLEFDDALVLQAAKQLQYFNGVHIGSNHVGSWKGDSIWRSTWGVVDIDFV